MDPNRVRTVYRELSICVSNASQQTRSRDYVRKSRVDRYAFHHHDGLSSYLWFDQATRTPAVGAALVRGFSMAERFYFLFPRQLWLSQVMYDDRLQAHPLDSKALLQSYQLLLP